MDACGLGQGERVDEHPEAPRRPSRNMDTTHQGDASTTAQMLGGERERQHWQ